MEITALQFLGIFLVILGVYGLYKGEIGYSIEIGGSSKANFKIGPKIEITKGTLKGRWVRPISGLIVFGGVLLVFMF